MNDLEIYNNISEQEKYLQLIVDGNSLVTEESMEIIQNLFFSMGKGIIIYSKNFINREQEENYFFSRNRFKKYARLIDVETLDKNILIGGDFFKKKEKWCYDWTQDHIYFKDETDMTVAKLII
jgi:hypothetical protein